MISPSRPPARAFSLVEVVIALGVAAFCLVAVFGLLPVGVNNNQMSITQTAAASVAASIVADLRATPAAATEVASPLFVLKVPPAGGGQTKHTVFLREDGSIAASSANADANADAAQNPIFRATVYFYPPGAASQRAATTARVFVTWPALADQNASQDPSRFSGSVESVVAIDRN